MLKRVTLIGLALVILAGAGLYFWAHAIFSSDPVRRQVAAQLSRALGQPVQIGGVSAAVIPRLTMSLSDVRIGEPAAITIDRLDVGTALRALLSRRIEHASATLSGARIELPLPAFAFGTAESSTDPGDEPAIRLVSVDEVVLRDVAIVSGGRVLRGDIALVPRTDGMTITSMALDLGGTPLQISGEITSFEGPVGELSLEAGDLDLFQLLGFVSDFARGAGSTTSVDADTPAATARSADTDMNLVVSVATKRAILGTLALEALGGQARVARDQITLDPVTFTVFEGAYTGSVTLGLSDTPDFALHASIEDLDMAAFTTFVGHPGVITGRLASRLDLTGRGTSPTAVVDSTQGTARLDITQGSIKGLGLVRSVVLAGSMRESSTSQATLDLDAEPFSRLGASLAIRGGTARTEDLRFESNDLLLTARGQIALDGSAIDLAGPLQLSDALSQQAGRDLVRYTQEDGRVTLPARITGSAGNLSVTLDVADLMKRAITNKAAEEAGKAIQRGLEGLFKR